MQKINNVVLTGGHAATTAIALVEALKDLLPNDSRIAWIGTRRAVEGKSGLTLEFKVFPKLGIDCYGIITGRVQRRFTKYTIFSLLKIPFGFLHALWLIVKIRPKVVVSFGGFAAFPVVVVASCLQIPVIIHEQTTGIGLANKLSIPFASKIAISRKESMDYYPENKTVLTGNPVRKAFFAIPPVKKIGVPPRIYATGGSRGSQVFNDHLYKILPTILRDFVVIHQCGDIDYPKFEDFRKSLTNNLRKNYEVVATLDPLTVPDVLEKADIVIGRSGANTVSEVIAAQRPALFVPIPWSQHDEQTKNAMLAEREGRAIVLSQNELSSEVLLDTIFAIRKNYKIMAEPRKSILRDLDEKAAENLAKLALSVK